MARVKWLQRDLMRGPYLALCTTEDEFHQALKGMKVPKPWPSFLKTTHSNATAQIFEHDKHGITAIICLGSTKGRPHVEVYGLLVHEAVHVWQHYRDSIGETHPGSEQEAYSIQSIAQRLMARYDEIVKEKKHADKA